MDFRPRNDGKNPCPRRPTCSPASRTISASCCTIRRAGATAAIDAPEAAPVEAALAKTGWRLTDILVTHHHGDHTAGIPELKRQHKCRVVAPRNEAQRIADVDADGRARTTWSASARSRGACIETPGHTPATSPISFPPDKLAFVGDTLFSIGCGRVIEGNPEMMWQSLIKLRDLPDDTKFYCGHEYTDANIRFAMTIEPDNEALAARADEVKRQLAAGKPTIPATIGAEKTRQSVPARRRCPRSPRRSVSPAGRPESVRGNARTQK